MIQMLAGRAYIVLLKCPNNELLSKAPLDFMYSQARGAGVPMNTLEPRTLDPSTTPHDNRGFGHAVVNGFFRAVSFDWAWDSHASWSQTNPGDRATP